MRVVQLTVTPDADGVRRIAIPAGDTSGGFEAVVVLTPVPVANGKPAAPTPEELGWPPGWERVYGSIQDETFVEPPDLPVTPVEPHRPPTPEELGWPPGYFERTAGSIPDPTFERGRQGEYLSGSRGL